VLLLVGFFEEIYIFRMSHTWFEKWFDTKYYHILYNNHSSEAAQTFIYKLVDFLQPRTGATALDLACGKGRHAVSLSEKGLDVIGLDISPKSIKAARTLENEQLQFYVQDMRRAFHSNYFEYVFNFFTSFGYFDRESDNLATLKNIATSLKPEGILILDYFNATHVKNQIEAQNNAKTTVTKKGINFHLEKRIEGKSVFKTIQFSDKEKDFSFEERVTLFAFADFQEMFRAAGFQITRTFGDYELNDFEENTSPRLIIIAKKIA
jgi:SAM-dependent methyltransferase